MKTAKRALAVIVSLIVFLSLSTAVKAQTAGTLTFSCTTAAPSGNWGDKHVLAVWIENVKSPSTFIKTKSKYGYEDDHLTSWIAKSGQNVADAVTGATLSTYGKQSIIWDGTDVNHNVVADGSYNVFIEMGWGRDKVVQHSVMSFTFTKANSTIHLTPAGNSNFTGVSIDWVPAVTLVNPVEDPNSVSVFPNPAKGIINLKFANNTTRAKIEVENSSGVIVYRNNMENGYSGILNIDLSSCANGLYFIKIGASEKQYIYKVLLNK